MDEEMRQSSGDVTKEIQNVLGKLQCHKWQKILDFEKILKQIRHAEKQHLRHKNVLSPSLSTGETSSTIIQQSTKLPTVPTAKYARPVRQVQRLDASDMPYYGVAPKQQELNVIVCNLCRGNYTRVGFKNHMILQHPSEWKAVEATPSLEVNDSGLSESSKHIQNVSGLPVNTEMIESSDIGGSSSTAPASIYTVSQRQKYAKHEPAIRTKHPKYKPNSALLETTNIGNCQTMTKDLKKVMVSISPSINRNTRDNIAGLESRPQSTVIYSTLTNSSCSLPTKTKINTASLEVKSPSILNQESADSSTSHSSSELEVTTSSTTARNNSNATTKINAMSKDKNKNIDSSKSSEYDRLMLSNTESQEKKTNTKKYFKNVDFCPNLKSSNIANSGNKLNQIVASNTNLHNILPQEESASNQEATQNTLDDSSILTLDDVIDSKFINDILSTTESEMHFDDNELEGGTHQQVFPHNSVKRMRYSENVLSSQQEVSGNFAPYQNQYVNCESNNVNTNICNNTQQTLTNVQLQHNDPNVTTINIMQIGEIFHPQRLNQYQNNVYTTSSSMLHPQQNIGQSNVLNAKQIIGIYSENDINKPYPNFRDVRNKLALDGGEYDGSDSTTRYFQLFNIPSLTDDINDSNDILLQNVPNRFQSDSQQYILPCNENHAIYDISDNNHEVGFKNQHRRQLLINSLNLTNRNTEQVSSSGLSRFSNIEHLPSSKSEPGICDFQVFDFSLIDFIQTNSWSDKHYRHTFSEVLHINDVIYAGIPVPISINCFGLLKLPFCTAATLKKHVLITRKANNSPITLSGGLNGMAGSNSRHSQSKSVLNISNINNSISNSPSNEYSIGGVTIISSNNFSNQGNLQQKQGNAGAGESLEFILNNNLHGSVISPMQVLHRQKSKSSPNASANISVSNYLRNKSQTGAMASLTSTTSSYRCPSRTNTNFIFQNRNTINVYNSNVNDKIKYVTTPHVCVACKGNVFRKSKLSSRHINHFLEGANKTKNFKPKNLHNIWENACNGQKDLNRMKIFFHNRRKIIDLSIKYKQAKN